MRPVGCVERCAGKEGVIVRVIGLIFTPACCTFRQTEGSEVVWVKSVKARVSSAGVESQSALHAGASSY